MKMFEKDMKFPLLLDTYGILLSERKREILEYYYCEDYSLSEISELTGISRQGVRDSIKKSEEEIYELEAKLQIVEKQKRLSALLTDTATHLDALTLSPEKENEDRLRAIRYNLLQITEVSRVGDVQE